MRSRHADGPTLRRALAGPALAVCALSLAACGGDGGAGATPYAGGGDVAIVPPPSATASPTALTYNGNRISLTNSDNGTHIAAAIGSDLLVQVSVPLADDCQGTHQCTAWHVDDAAGVLLRAQDLTTCSKDACTAQRETFLQRVGTATLSLVAVQQCSPAAGSRCEPQTLSTLWSAHVSVGNST